MTHNETNARVPKRIPFRMHPRVFAALGADLVTNDVVAVIELVKNSYDAFAKKAWVRFGEDPNAGRYLEVEDNGQGMDRAAIEDVWCVVATPYRLQNPTVTEGKETRRVAGEKGLGRLAVARLGDRLDMLTQAENRPCWHVTVDWSDLADAGAMESCFVECTEYDGASPFVGTGTRVRVYGLKSAWDEGQVADLEENLSRLLPPFAHVQDFSVFLRAPGEEQIEEQAKIQSPEFLSRPKYCMTGHVDGDGNIHALYKYSPIGEGQPRRKSVSFRWSQVWSEIQDPRLKDSLSDNCAGCGPFEVEIRVWDIGADDTGEIAERFDIEKTQVRKAIRAHKGISVYRDGILVLPKSEGSRDWLGLDLRRVSRLTRLSTSQIVGYVSITADNNPGIRDTSDREGFRSTPEVAVFEELLKAIIGSIENERSQDRQVPGVEQPMEELLGNVSGEELLSETSELAEEGASAQDLVPIVTQHSEQLQQARKSIQTRFTYYSRLATVGTIAQMLVHEIRNRTTSFGSFVQFIKERVLPVMNGQLTSKAASAGDSVACLERLADTFAPLASRAFRRRRRNSILEERIRTCLTLAEGEIKRKGIITSCPQSTETSVAVDPGELDTVLLNLINNATYWLDQAPKEKRLEFRLAPIMEGKRVRVFVHDSGPGVRKEDSERIFWPGVTGKPSGIGIGMGLTVASELVAEYGGKMALRQPGTLGGASFCFDLPTRS